MSGLRQVKTREELCTMVEEIGFIPLFACSIKGFSVEELTPRLVWWTGDADTDPWEWREQIASEGHIAYGKFFGQKSAFISREWFPILAAFRRDGYVFRERYEAGLASKKARDVMDLLEEHGMLASWRLKRLAGFGKEGEKGFEGVLAQLQMQTYVTVCGFERKKDRFGQEYGWPASVYSTAERFFGEDHIGSCGLGPDDAGEKLVEQICRVIPGVSVAQAEGFMR